MRSVWIAFATIALVAAPCAPAQVTTIDPNRAVDGDLATPAPRATATPRAAATPRKTPPAGRG